MTPDAAPEALEVLARRLLELLGRVTGLESTYLTSGGLLCRADGALYGAKSAGRDSVHAGRVA